LMGVKPLVYSAAPGGIYFASELKALLPSLERREIDVRALHSYLVFEYIPAPLCIFKNIEKLPAGGRLVWEKGGIRTWTESLPPAEELHGSEAECREQLRTLIRESLDLQCPREWPLVLFLSGGLDSGVLASRMPGRGDALTIDVAGCEPEEADLATEVARRHTWRHHRIKLDHTGAMALVNELAQVVDEPYADASLVPTYLVCKQARAFGPVALSGDGGDELFGGYQTYPAHRFSGWYGHLPAIVRRLVAGGIEHLPPLNGHLSPDFLARKFLRGAGLHPAAANAGFWGAFLPLEARRLLTDDVNAALGDWEPHQHARDIYEREGRSGLAAVMDMDLRLHLGENLLMKLDKASGAVGLEVRVPYLHTPLVRFARAMPDKWKVRMLQTKVFFRRTFSDDLPAAVAWRKKHGFNIPLRAWLRDELYEWVASALQSQCSREQGLFRPAAVDRLLEEHRTGRRNHRQELWALFMFQLWYERYTGPLS
ncbi:hypothetical protein JW905_03625, partial [bacterium]|nr:hypothetical protein [candidate division CSSED10-310 bacterium]